jgi:hypothetical protein
MKNEKETVKLMIKYVKKGFGSTSCKQYNPDCANCHSQLLLGLLVWYLDLLKYDEGEYL